MPVYQEKNRSKWTKDGRSWYFRVWYINEYGFRKQKESGKYFTKKEAKDAEVLFLNKIKSNNNIDYNVYFETIYNEWLDYKKNLVKYTTYYGIEKMVGKHILSFFKTHKLFSINVNVIRLFTKEVEEKQICINKKNSILGYLSEILNYATIYYKFDIKIIKSIIKLRNDTPNSSLSNAEENFWTVEEFNIFITFVDNEFYKLIFIFLYKTGVRLGEFRALTWNDINFDKKQISITKSMSYHYINGIPLIVTPKTQNSVRIFSIDDNLFELLVEHYNNEKLYTNFNNSWYVFGGVEQVYPTTLRRHLNNYISKSKVKKITLHGFRHSHVSLLIYLNCDSRDVAERIGDTVSMVEKTYYHMFPQKKQDTINKLNTIKF